MGRQVRVRHSGQKMDDFARTLDEYDIVLFYKRANSTHCIFNVRNDQWQWVVDLLHIAGAQVEHRPSPWAARWRVERPGQMPNPWKRRKVRA